MFIMTPGAAQRPINEGPSLPPASTLVSHTCRAPFTPSLPHLVQHPYTKEAIFPTQPANTNTWPPIPGSLCSVHSGQPTRPYAEVAMLSCQGYITLYDSNTPPLGNIWVTPFLCWPRAACGILVPRPGLRPVPPAVGARSPDSWRTRELPESVLSSVSSAHIVTGLCFPPHYFHYFHIKIFPNQNTRLCSR